jgi:hypothetical protein
VTRRGERSLGGYLATVRALILGSPLREPLEEMLDRRHSWGADRHERGVERRPAPRLLRAHADTISASKSHQGRSQAVGLRSDPGAQALVKAVDKLTGGDHLDVELGALDCE